MIRKFLSEYFYFTRSEKNGTIVLSIILVMVFILPYAYNAFKSSKVYQADQAFLKQVENFYATGEEVVYIETAGETGQPYIQEGNVPVQSSLPEDSDDLPRLYIEINSADTLELMKIKGIGEVLSRRILKYRNILGGYQNKLQLLEVYGIDIELYTNIQSFVYTDTSLIVKLNLRTDEFGVLLRHPYLNYSQVSQIFKLREAASLNSDDDLLETSSFSIEDIGRLSPYIDFD